MLHTIQILYAIPRPLSGDLATERGSVPKLVARRLEGGIAPEVIWAPLLALGVLLCAAVALVLLYRRKARASLEYDRADEVRGGCSLHSVLVPRLTTASLGLSHVAGRLGCSPFPSPSNPPPNPPPNPNPYPLPLSPQPSRECMLRVQGLATALPLHWLPWLRAWDLGCSPLSSRRFGVGLIHHPL